jgi:hypothetical protein
VAPAIGGDDDDDDNNDDESKAKDEAAEEGEGGENESVESRPSSVKSPPQTIVRSPPPGIIASRSPPSMLEDEVSGEVEAVQEGAEPQAVDEEEEERQRRAALAARMAKLGGARIGMGAPVFGRPAVPPPSKKPSLPVPAPEVAEPEPPKDGRFFIQDHDTYPHFYCRSTH